MKSDKKIKNIVSLLIEKEIDTTILLDLFLKYYDISSEVLLSMLNFKVIKCTNMNGSIYKGVITFDDNALTVNLRCTYEGNKPTYILVGINS